MIDAQFVKRGKTVSARRLRNNAKKFDNWFVDYRNMGYVTEVKDQVRYSQIHLEWDFLFQNRHLRIYCMFEMFFTGLLWLVLGLQHHGRYWGTNIQEDRPACIFEWTKPGGLLQILRYLWLQWCLDGQRLRLRGQQRAAVDKHLSIHLSGEAPPAGSAPIRTVKTVHYSVSSLPVTLSSVFLSTGYPALLLWQQTFSCPYQGLQVHTQRRWAGSGWCRGNYRANHSSRWCRSFKLPVLQLRLIVLPPYKRYVGN